MNLLWSLMLLPVAANTGGADCKEAFEKGYVAGKEIQELRTEVQELRLTVTKLVELLQSKGGDLASIQAPARVEPKDEADRSVAPKSEGSEFGTVTGKVSFLAGSNSAWVYVENVGGRLARGRKVNVIQKNRQFAPRFIVVQKGTEVMFPNEDAIYHNVFAQNPSATFDLGIYRKGDDAKSYIFTKPGLIDIFCNMHAKMNAEILVVPNHLYTQARTNGSFKLVRVPAGRRKIVAWGPGGDQVSAWVEVAANGTSDVSLELAPRKKGSHLNKNGQPYGSYQ
jgi:plastocyanin